MSPDLQKLLDALNGGSLDFPRFIEAVYRAGYTGPFTVHCLNGVAKQIDLGAPVRLSIVEGLDKPGRSRASS